FNNLGNALKASGDYYGAESKYEEALRINPDYVPALNNLGLVLTKFEKYNHAVELYKKALSLDPNIAGIYCNLGTLYNDYLKDPNQAEFFWNKFLMLEPESKEAGIISAKLTEIRMKKR
ncbi:tetratricopeptide repeat protein, partial [bacterium]|nr:tetratricopeptide repeat protein [bacterium]